MKAPIVSRIARFVVILSVSTMLLTSCADKSYSSNNNVEKRIPNAASTAAATEQPQATYNDIKLPSVPGETEHPKNSESQYESTEATEYNQTVLQTQPIPKWVPTGEYHSEVADITLDFLGYDSSQNRGIIATYGQDDNGEAFSSEIYFTVTELIEDKMNYAVIRFLNPKEMYELDYFLYFYDLDIFQCQYNLTFTNDIFSTSFLSGYEENDGLYHMRFAKDPSKFEQQTLINLPDRDRKLIYECSDPFNPMGKMYFYEDELEKIYCPEEEQDGRYRSCLYAIKVGDIIEPPLIEHKIVDYENMSGLITDWALDLGSNMTYGEMVQKYPSHGFWFYRMDENYSRLQKTDLVRDLMIEMYLSQDVEYDSWGEPTTEEGVGLYINGQRSMNGADEYTILGMPTYYLFKGTETITYSGGEYSSSVEYNNDMCSVWVGDDFCIANVLGITRYYPYAEPYDILFSYFD